MNKVFEFIVVLFYTIVFVVFLYVFYEIIISNIVFIKLNVINFINLLFFIVGLFAIGGGFVDWVKKNKGDSVRWGIASIVLLFFCLLAFRLVVGKIFPSAF